MSKTNKYQIAFLGKDGKRIGVDVIGIPVEIKGFESMQFFVHHSVEPGFEKYWCVSEVEHGMAIVKNVWGRTKAISAANRVMREAGTEIIRKAMQKLRAERERMI